MFPRPMVPCFGWDCRRYHRTKIRLDRNSVGAHNTSFLHTQRSQALLQQQYQSDSEVPYLCSGTHILSCFTGVEELVFVDFCRTNCLEMAGKLRLSITDIIHRGVVYSLVGLSVWGVVMMGVVHRDTLRRGREALALKEAEKQKEQAEQANELALAEAAQASLQRGGKSW